MGQTVSVAAKGKRWVVTIDDHDGKASETLEEVDSRADAVERALRECSTRGLDLAEPMEPKRKAKGEPKPETA